MKWGGEKMKVVGAKRVQARLSSLQISKLKVPGIYEDGGGLRLVIGPNLTKRWVVRVTINGRRVERGLGSFPVVSLETARKRALEHRSAAAEGRDLGKERNSKLKASAVTFETAFGSFFEIRRQTLTNGKHVDQWQTTMATYVFPTIGRSPIDHITSSHVLNVLAPIWFSKPETARRVLQRMEAVFKSAILRGHRTLASPCIGIAQELGTRHREVRHHASLPWQNVPNFVETLQSCPSHSSTRYALEFLILTAARSGEVRFATWNEISWDAREWRLPAARMKARAPHTIPLSARALQILRAIQSQQRGELIFAGRSGQPLSDMTFTKLLRDLGMSVTAHGFRTSFKVWAAEVVRVRDEVSEAALAHKIPQKVRAAYLRTEFLEERRQLMELWGTHVTSGTKEACDRANKVEASSVTRSFAACRERPGR